MAMLILGSLLALAQAASAARPGPPPKPVENPAGKCLETLVYSAEAPRRRVSFSATKILDLQFHTYLRGRLGGEHVLNFMVYTPRGHLYQQLDVPFRGGWAKANEGMAGPGMRDDEGDAHPQEEEVVAAPTLAEHRGFSISARLPVAGTSIMTSSLYGKWKVIPHLDGSLEACGAATGFSITP
jgi:hypothetical protein